MGPVYVSHLINILAKICSFRLNCFVSPSRSTAHNVEDGMVPLHLYPMRSCTPRWWQDDHPRRWQSLTKFALTDTEYVPVPSRRRAMQNIASFLLLRGVPHGVNWLLQIGSLILTCFKAALTGPMSALSEPTSRTNEALLSADMNF